MMRSSIKLARVMFGIGAIALGLGSACGSQTIQAGTQQVGQVCYDNTDCATGLVCTPSRICVPRAEAPESNNVSPNNVTNNNANNTSPQNNGTPNNISPNNNNDAPNNDVSNNDTPNNTSPQNNVSPNNVSPNNDLPNNTSPECRIGTRYCESEAIFVECVETREGAEEVRRECPDDSFCDGGFCEEFCVDRDGDGAFANCEPFDCNDRSPEFSPFNPEACGDGVDNNCNNQVDEGCEQGCCLGGCAGDTFCDDCQCVPYEPFRCSVSNQPCFNIDAFENGYYCADLSGNGEGTCIGLCDLNSPDPSGTCPEMGQSCTFGDGGQYGFCFDDCSRGDNCGSPDLGCFVYNDPAIPQDGICTPADPTKKIGDPCDEELDGFFGCEPGAVCVNLNPQFGSGTCVESCRPFLGNGASDCSPGTYCLGFSEAIGVCTADNGLEEGDRCSQFYNSCGEDNVTCYPTRQNGLRCQRTCRLVLGDADCAGAQVCRNLSQDNGEIGVCRPR